MAGNDFHVPVSSICVAALLELVIGLLRLFDHLLQLDRLGAKSRVKRWRIDEQKTVG